MKPRYENEPALSEIVREREPEWRAIERERRKRVRRRPKLLFGVEFTRRGKEVAENRQSGLSA